MDMTWTQWHSVVNVKVKGVKNLHHALENQPLDFFWMASSIVTCLDQPGQANYSAGCAYLEAFCQYRHSKGLPATVLNICPIEGVGYVANNWRAKRNMKAQGLYFLGEREFLDFVTLNILDSKPQDIFMQSSGSTCLKSGWRNQGQVFSGLRSASEAEFGYALDNPNNKTNWRRDRRMGFYHNVKRHSQHVDATSAATEMGALANLLTQVSQEPGLLERMDTTELFAQEIGREVNAFLLRHDSDIDIHKTLAQSGLDSLVALELRRWIRQVFGTTISVLEIMGAGNLSQLAEVVKDRLAQQLSRE